MLKHSLYIFTFLSISFGADLCADLDEEKRTEETIQDKKRVDQQVEDKKVESDLEQKRRIDKEVDRKRFEQEEQEKRRDRSDNASKSKKMIADKDDEQKKGNEKDALKQPEEKGPMQEREQQKREGVQKKDEQQFQPQRREEKQKNNEQQIEKQKNNEQQFEKQSNQGEHPNLKPLVPQPLTKERFDKDSSDWNLKGKNVRDDFRKNRTQTHVFDKAYWDNYNKRSNKWHFKDNMNWWTPVSVPAIDNWLRIRGGRQRYYYYGDNGVIYYSDNSSYNNFIAVPGYSEFVYQGVVLARNNSKVNYQDIQWMPVGIFALASPNQSNTSPNDYFSLAISPEGIVGGVYFNPKTNKNEEIEGTVDSQALRVVWKFTSSDWPVFETGLFNLTQNESTALVHYPEGRTDSQLLIRLQQ